MDTGRVDPSLLRGLAADPATTTGTFVPGQHLAGRVLQALADQHFLLAFGERRVVAQSALPLMPGQDIAVEVMKGGQTVELRLEQQVLPATPEGEERYALAALLHALKAAGPAAPGLPSPDTAALFRALASLQQSGETAVPAPEMEALARLLQPLALTAGPASLAGALRDLFENSGLLFEARVRAVLAANPGATLEQVLTTLRADLKALLGRLARETAGWPELDAEADAGAGRPLVPDAAAARTLVEQQSLLTGQVLTRQAGFALNWLSDGTIRFGLPVRLPSGEARAEIRLRREPPEEGDPAEGAAFNVTLRVDSEAFGAIEARARWCGPIVRAAFCVERDATRDVLLPELDSLARRLGTIFTHVTTDVRVDPARLMRADGPEPLPELPGGSIVNVRV